MVPVSDLIIKLLREYVAMRPESDYDTFFLNIDGKPLRVRTVQEEIKELGERAGIRGVRVSCHSLRYTVARNYLSNGGSPLTLMRVMGHRSIETTLIYAELFQPDISNQHAKYSPATSLLSKP